MTDRHSVGAILVVTPSRFGVNTRFAPTMVNDS